MTVISVESIAKRYRLGLIGRTALHEDLSRWWAGRRGRPDPTLRVAQGSSGGGRGATEPVDSHIWALREVSFEVQRGEVLGIIGRNGAGKSTLLKILSRVTAPTEGCVKMKGRVASLLEVGTGFHPDLTGRENIFLNGTILGMRLAEVRRKFDEIVAFSGLETFIDTPVKRYSSGMYVRLAFAVAAHLDPDILLVDEVLAVGDMAFRKKCLGKMSDVARGGRTVLFVSHNMSAIESLCGRVILLEAGRVVKDAPSRDAVAHYSLSLAHAAGPVFESAANGGTPGWFERVSIAASDGGTNGCFHTGDDLTIDLILNPLRPLVHPRIGIGINDHLARRVTTVGTEFTPGYVPRIDGRTTVRCRLPGLPLLAGRYTLTIALCEGRELVAELDGRIRFDVTAGDYLGPGSTLREDQGFFACRAEWSDRPA